MAIPLSTTTITIERPSGGPYETPTLTTVAAGVRAVIGSPEGSERRQGGSAERIDAVLNCDPTDIANGDTVTDENLVEEFRVVWTERREAMGLDHVRAGLLRITGVSG